MQIRATEKTEEFGKCGCGRSPTGKCIGWHALSEEQLVEARRQWDLDEYTKQAQSLWNDSCTAPRLAGEIPGLTPNLTPPADKMSYGEFCAKFPVEEGDKITVDEVITLEQEHGIADYYEKLEIFRRQEYEKYLAGDPYYNA